MVRALSIGQFNLTLVSEVSEMFRLELKKMLLSLATLSLALVVNVSAVNAATTSVCPGDGSGTRQFTLTTENPIGNSCYYWGDNNDANDTAFNLKRLDDFGADHDLLSKVEYDAGGTLQREGSNDSLLNQSIVDLLDSTGGTFTVDATGFDDVLLVFKTGTGGSTPGFAAFSLTPAGFTEGEWAVTLQQGLSHVSLYGAPAPIPLPAAGLLLLTAIGGLGFGARRRRKAA